MYVKNVKAWSYLTYTYVCSESFCRFRRICSGHCLEREI